LSIWPEPTKTLLAAGLHLLICIICSLERSQEVGHADFAKEVLFARAANPFDCEDIIKAAIAIST
jgi:hypothetical protein